MKVYTHTYKHEHTYTHTYTHTYCVCIIYIYIYIYIYMCVYICWEIMLQCFYSWKCKKLELLSKGEIANEQVQLIDHTWI